MDGRAHRQARGLPQARRSGGVVLASRLDPGLRTARRSLCAGAPERGAAGARHRSAALVPGSPDRVRRHPGLPGRSDERATLRGEVVTVAEAEAVAETEAVTVTVTVNVTERVLS